MPFTAEVILELTNHCFLPFSRSHLVLLLIKYWALPTYHFKTFLAKLELYFIAVLLRHLIRAVHPIYAWTTLKLLFFKLQNSIRTHLYLEIDVSIYNHLLFLFIPFVSQDNVNEHLRPNLSLKKVKGVRIINILLPQFESEGREQLWIPSNWWDGVLQTHLSHVIEMLDGSLPLNVCVFLLDQNRFHRYLQFNDCCH